MNKAVQSLLSVLLVLVVILTGCAGKQPQTENENTGNSSAPTGSAQTGERIRVAFYVNGTLGDKGFHDSAQAGMEQAALLFDLETKTVQGGTNPADWGPGLESLVSGGEYDVIVLGSSQMTDIAKDVAGRYPDQKFIFFDNQITDVPNLYSMTYSQSEGSFLAGAFAALVTTSTELEGINPDKVIGFVGGMDIPIINDFKAGYEQGARYIDPDIRIIASYAGDFKNSPKGKELALAQYNNQSADIIYAVAGGAGLGVLEAGHSLGKYSIGVDLNQNGLYPGSVLTSMLKNVDKSVINALGQYTKNELQFGTSHVLGIKEDGVGLAMDSFYEEHVPANIQEKVKEIYGKIISGEIQVESTLN